MNSAVENLQQLTERSIRSRVLVCYGLCAVANSEVKVGQFERATGTVQAVRKNLEEINLLTAEPQNILGAPIRNLKEMLDELDHWAWKIGRAICRSGC
jgi:hypothetical protein